MGDIIAIRRNMQIMRRGVGDVAFGGTLGTTAAGQINGPDVTSTGHSTRDFIGTLIGAGLQTVTNIWGNNAAAAQSAALQQQQLYAQQQAQLAASQQRTTSVGVGVDGSGIRLSDGSHLGWLPIIGVVVGLVLLQSKGFSRR